MGHNNLTVNNQAPTINSKIDFTNVYPSILIGRNHSQAYSSNPSSPSLSVGSALYVYDTAPINTIAGATITSNSGWVSGVTLPSGTYVMSMLFSFVFTASGSIRYGFKTGGNWEGSIGGCGGLQNVYLNGSGVSVNIKAFTSATSYAFNVFSSSNVDTVSNQGNIPSEQSYILIEQVVH
jgi:hypothetical protein